jgi:hypothetical protein
MRLDRRETQTLLKFNLNAEEKCPMLQRKLPDRSDDAGRRVLASIRPYNRDWGSAVLHDPQVFPLPALAQRPLMYELRHLRRALSRLEEIHAANSAMETDTVGRLGGDKSSTRILHP